MNWASYLVGETRNMGVDDAAAYGYAMQWMKKAAAQGHIEAIRAVKSGEQFGM